MVEHDPVNNHKREHIFDRSRVANQLDFDVDLFRNSYREMIKGLNILMLDHNNWVRALSLRAQIVREFAQVYDAGLIPLNHLEQILSDKGQHITADSTQFVTSRSVFESTPEELPNFNKPLRVFPVLRIMIEPKEFIKRASIPDRNLIAGYYTPARPGTLLLINSDDLLSNPEQALKLQECIEKLTGLNPETRRSVWRTYYNFPLVLGATRCELAHQKWWDIVKISQYRVPYGSLSLTREYLTQQQVRIEKGFLAGCTIEIEGLISRDLVRMMTGSSIIDPGLFPDIEFVYRFQLPSGRPYLFTIKPARNYTQRSATDYTKFSADDIQAIRLLERHFLDPENKRDLRIFTQIDSKEFSAPLRRFADNPETITTPRIYAAFRAGWYAAIYNKLEAAQITTSRVGIVSEWASVEMEDLGVFKGKVLERLKVIPNSQSFYPAEFFTLTNQELDHFMEVYVPKIFDLCNQERARIKEERLNNRNNQRKVNGWNGPEGGYALSLDYMLMDMIIDLRKKQHFRMVRAKRDSILESEVVVPPHIGRSYENPERFIGIEQVSKILNKLPNKRTTDIILNDPLSSDGINKNPPVKVEELDDWILEENLKRLSPLLAAELKLNRAKIKARAVSGQFSLLFEEVSDLRKRIKILERDLKTLIADKTSAFSALTQQMRANGGSKAENKEQFDKLKKEYENKTAQITSERQLIRLQLYEASYRMLGEKADNFVITIKQIIDQELVKFIYSIGADDKPVLCLEEIHGDRRLRATHTECLAGKNMYAGGELVFIKHQETFHSVADWLKFKEKLESVKPGWRLIEINNLSGHYLPESTSLPYVPQFIIPSLKQQGIITDNYQLVDRLAAGLRLRGIGAYRF